MEISLSKGKVSLIDNEDFYLIEEFSWRAQQNWDGRWYAMAWNSYPNFVMMHRVIMAVDEEFVVHHVNNDGLDNRKQNLRVATVSQNNAAAKPMEGKTSEFKGIHFETSRKRWKATIRCNGVFQFLGRFDNEVEAAIAYDVAAKELFGEFAYLNFGDENGS